MRVILLLYANACFVRSGVYNTCVGPTGAGECGGQEIDGVQQREGVHPQCGGEHGQGVQEAIPDRPGQLPPSKIKGDEERWLHVPCLPRQDLRRPHRPGWSWHSLRDPLSGCLG